MRDGLMVIALVQFGMNKNVTDKRDDVLTKS